MVRHGGLLACTQDVAESCVDNYCSDANLPFCDVDGALGGAPQTCIAVDCNPGDFIACRGDQAITCDIAGTNYDLAPCAAGCDPTSGCNPDIIVECEPDTIRCGDRVVERCDANSHFTTEACDVACIDSPAPHCAYLEPKYLPDICDTPASGHLDFGPFDTNIDTQCNGGIVPQPDGPDLCVVRYATITIPAGVEAKVTGARALALVADDSITVTGVLDISADGSTSGPGAGAVGFGGGTRVGGGGGGFHTGGAAGGSAVSPGGGTDGGPRRDALALPALVGGEGELGSTSPTRVGGGGGGAATLIACRGDVTITGTLDAGGGGGRGGGDGDTRPNNVLISGGGGGGSGGQIVIQGVLVRVMGILVANGGAGGNGSRYSRNPVSGNDFGPEGFVAQAGEDGRRDALPATNPVAPDYGARGGAGGTGADAPRVGGAGAPEQSNQGTIGGGGGGAVGYFRIVSHPDGVIAAPLVTSPPLENPEAASFR